MNIQNKVAVITGGASGVGRATCLALAAAGARVYLGDINIDGANEVAQQINQESGFAKALKLDVTDPESIRNFADTVHADEHKADIVINAAGWDIIEPFIKNSEEYWSKIVELNYMGVVRFTRAFLDPMIAAGEGGRIVNIASDAGRVGSGGETVYAGAKGAVIAFGKSLAREMARYQILVNSVCPGPTDTPLFQMHSDKAKQALINAIPFRRLAKPEEIADVVLFFSSQRCSFVTGQVLSVSGGLTMAG